MPRILTYNVRHCLGTDGRLSPERVAEVIASCEPDVVALQELDMGRARTHRVDQARVIADALGMRHHFFPAIVENGEGYGDAILTARPCRLVKAGLLPSLSWGSFAEPRGALWVSVDIGETTVQVINTHLGLLEMVRHPQIGGLLGPDWLGHPSCRAPVILAGDFNAIPRSRTYNRLVGPLRDAHRALALSRHRPTFPSRAPLLRLDHVFVSASITVLAVETIRTPLARIASDHLPLLVEFGVIGCEPAVPVSARDTAMMER